MRVFAVSDIHIDYEENRRFLNNLSTYDYQDDVLILAGDISDKDTLVEQAFSSLTKRFMKVLFTPGNHDLWVLRSSLSTSLDSFFKIHEIAESHGVTTQPFQASGTGVTYG